MRAVVQRVSSADVSIDGLSVGRVDAGLLVLLGVTHTDTVEGARWLAGKIAGLRIFEDDQGKMNRSVSDADGRVLVVSQFTLYGDCRKGRRPSFDAAARPEQARALYESVIEELRRLGLQVATGVFQAHMAVTLVNDGPVTLLLDTPE